MRIVIVDDDKLAAKALADKLNKYEEAEIVGMAYNGINGLNMINESHPDVLFLDIELPDISGIEFLERIDTHSQHRCRVVMYTAHDRYMLQAFRNMAFDYLLKPIDDDELRAIMRRVCIDIQHDHKLQPASNEGANNNGSDSDDGIVQRNDGKFVVYTNSVDFRLVDIRDIGMFAYNHDLRVWEVIISGMKEPVRLKRSVNSDVILDLNESLVRVSQKHIINMSYLMEVTDNTCHFYPPFDKADDVKVGRFFRKKLIERFSSF